MSSGCACRPPSPDAGRHSDASPDTRRAARRQRHTTRRRPRTPCDSGDGSHCSPARRGLRVGAAPAPRRRACIIPGVLACPWSSAGTVMATNFGHVQPTAVVPPCFASSTACWQPLGGLRPRIGSRGARELFGVRGRLHMGGGSIGRLFICRLPFAAQCARWWNRREESRTPQLATTAVPEGTASEGAATADSVLRRLSTASQPSRPLRVDRTR